MHNIESQYGSQPRVRLRCVNNDTDTEFTPGAVFVIVTKPDGTVTEYDDGDPEVVEDSTGIYDYSPTLDQWGNWYVRMGFTGDVDGSDEWRISVPKPVSIVLTGIQTKAVPASRTLVVSSGQDEDEAEISGNIRQKKSNTLTWLIIYSKTQLAYADLVSGATAPTVGGAQAANCTISGTQGTGWGIDPDGKGILISVVTGSGALPTDEIYVDLTVSPEGSEAHTTRIPVEILE